MIESLDSVVAPAEKASSVAPEVEKSVETMLAAISRLRAERDQLLLDFDYLQMESRFKALQTTSNEVYGGNSEIILRCELDSPCPRRQKRVA